MIEDDPFMPTWTHSDTINVLRRGCSFSVEHAKIMLDCLHPYKFGMGKAIDNFQSNLPLVASFLVNNSDSII